MMITINDIKVKKLINIKIRDMMIYLFNSKIKKRMEIIAKGDKLIFSPS